MIVYWPPVLPPQGSEAAPNQLAVNLVAQKTAPLLVAVAQIEGSPRAEVDLDAYPDPAVNQVAEKGSEEEHVESTKTLGTLVVEKG